jgi:thiamine biosynthesis protein ThiS
MEVAPARFLTDSIFNVFMNVLLNGEKVDAGEARTIAELVERYQLSPQSILVEHNSVALHRRDWPQTGLIEGDRIEFIRVVAGG